MKNLTDFRKTMETGLDLHLTASLTTNHSCRNVLS